MKRRRASAARGIGIALMLAWSVIPIYWAIKISLQTESDARAHPAQYVPIRPTLDNFPDVALRARAASLGESVSRP